MPKPAYSQAHSRLASPRGLTLDPGGTRNPEMHDYCRCACSSDFRTSKGFRARWSSPSVRAYRGLVTRPECNNAGAKSLYSRSRTLSTPSGPGIPGSPVLTARQPKRVTADTAAMDALQQTSSLIAERWVTLTTALVFLLAAVVAPSVLRHVRMSAIPLVGGEAGSLEKRRDAYLNSSRAIYKQGYQMVGLPSP